MPDWQLAVMLHTSHSPPLRPHATFWLPGWHVPSLMQQPVHVVGEQLTFGEPHAEMVDNVRPTTKPNARARMGAASHILAGVRKGAVGYVASFSSAK